MQENKTEDYYKNIKITDDYMFSTVFSDEKRCRELLQRILGVEIAELQVISAQQTFKNNPDAKGIRLDIYVKDVEGNAYDIEMQLTDTKELPLRSRYYHSEMDSYQIRVGAKYKDLKHSIVIFICKFDLFEKNRSIYTFETICREDTGISLGDNRQTIFVNLEGDRDELSEELDCLLEYLATGKAGDSFLKGCQEEVERLRMDDEWRENYMTLQMKMDERYEAGLEAGLEAGENNKLKSLIKKKLEKGKTIEQIAEECEEGVEMIQRLIEEM